MSAREVVHDIALYVDGESSATATLVDSEGTPTASTGGIAHPVTTPVTLSPDSSGHWSEMLDPAVDILPAGTLWRIDEATPGNTLTLWLDVPDVAGSHDADDIAVPDPTPDFAFPAGGGGFDQSTVDGFAAAAGLSTTFSE